MTPTEAEACGGTFCDAGPTPMPVDQTGENIIFHLGEGTVEAHIQIQYDPNSGANQFAWVIPVMALPEFEVGSQLFFDAVLNGSVPRYLNVQTSDACEEDFDQADEAGDGGESDSGANGTGDGDGDPGGPDVVYQSTVGAFEVAVLDGGTVEGVMQWLGDNGYQQDPAAEPILAQYLAEDFMFVAMKLSNQAGVDEIHPIVIRYEGVEPCVPIRLTRIAAQEDMDIRVFFLDSARVVPVNYRHVLVNPLKIDWFNTASNYKEVISMAVDANEADGNAFVTEYAGPSNVIQPTYISDAWDSAAIAALGASPVGVIDALGGQGLISCDPEWNTDCTYSHPLLKPILDQYVPVPDGVTAVDFYACLDCYADLIDLAAWDAQGFADMFEERIIKPAAVARELVEANGYLTRMYTTISPGEMNDDPIFRRHAELPDVASLRQSTQTLHCDGSTTVTIPDGRQVYFPPGAPLTWPDFQDEMPWEEDVHQANMADDAPLISLVDNTDRINELLEEHNKANGDQDGDGNGNVGEDADEAGCACTVDQGKGGLLFGFATLGLFGLVRRRRS